MMSRRQNPCDTWREISTKARIRQNLEYPRPRNSSESQQSSRPLFDPEESIRMYDDRQFIRPAARLQKEKRHLDAAQESQVFRAPAHAAPNQRPGPNTRMKDVSFDQRPFSMLSLSSADIIKLTGSTYRDAPKAKPFGSMKSHQDEYLCEPWSPTITKPEMDGKGLSEPPDGGFLAWAHVFGGHLVIFNAQ